MSIQEPSGDAVQKIVQDTLSGKAHFDAWCAVVHALYKEDPTWCARSRLTAIENAVSWIADAGKRKKEATELAEMLREFMRAANSRGRLSPGGCDANTDAGHMYARALDYFAEHGYPC